MSKFLRRRPRTIREVLEDLGLTPEAIDAAEATGTDELLAIDAVVLPKPGKFTIDELADRVGTDVEVVRIFWRALGFVDAGDSERTFTKRDVAILRSLVGLTDRGLLDPELSVGVARVVGVSMAQVAAAIVDATESRSEERREATADADPQAIAQYESNSFALRAGELLPFMTDVIDYSFRRHLRAAARRQVVLSSAVDGPAQVIGFADLVKFTELSLQLDEHELAQVVGRFDQLVNHAVVQHGGRIVKMIGDAAMFTVVSPHSAASIALEMSEAARLDELLPGLRIGMASGQALARDGDLYGPVVNLASRLGTIGRAGAVNIDVSLRDSIASDHRFSLRSLGERNLRHIGDVRVYRLSQGPDWVVPADRV